MKIRFTSLMLIMIACITCMITVYASPYLHGKITMDGSSTVFPIVEAISEEYAREQPHVKIPISISGTGGGFHRFVQGEIDINNASRPMKLEEQQVARKNSISYTSFPIAYDGLTMITHPDNTWLTNITDEELQKLWAENGTRKKWSDINTAWPKKEIHFYAPGVDSGTYDYFQDAILKKRKITRFVTFSEDDNVLIRAVMNDRYAVAFLGFAYYTLNKTKVQAVPVNGVLPTKQSIQSGRYAPLSRALYLYVNEHSIRTNKSVADYLRFAFLHGGTLAEEAGYVQMSQQTYRQQIKKLEKIQRSGT